MAARTLSLIAAAAVALAVAGPAVAAPGVHAFWQRDALRIIPDAAVAWPTDSDGFRAAVVTAAGFWGRQACGGRVTFEWAPLDRGINAYATYNPDRTACDIALNPWPWNGGKVVQWSWARLCTVLAHEYGHLLGRHHDDREFPFLMGAAYRGIIVPCGGWHRADGRLVRSLMPTAS